MVQKTALIEDTGLIELDSYDLFLHRARHSAKNLAKQFGCALCDKSFVTSWQLKSHSKTHLGKLEGLERRYKCSHCESQFDKPQSLAGKIDSQVSVNFVHHMTS